MTTLLLFAIVAVIIGVVSYVTNAGFGDRRAIHKIGDGEGGPWSTVATPLDAVRPGETRRVSGRVEAVLQPFGGAVLPERWTASIRPSDAGGTRSVFVLADGDASLRVEIPYGTVETLVRGAEGWSAAPAVTPAIAPGMRVDVYGTARTRAAGLRGSDKQLVMTAAYVSGEPPPSK